MRTNRLPTVIPALLSLSMAAMEMTVVSTAMPTVVGDLGGIHPIPGFTAYLLTSTVTVPLRQVADSTAASRCCWADRAVPDRLMASGLAQGSGRCASARCRAWAGHAADHAHHRRRHLQPEERSACRGVRRGLGVAADRAALGRHHRQHLSWRWVFLINVPAGIAAAGLLMVALHEDVEHHQHSLTGRSGLLTLG
jgi:MFS family permease